MPTSAEMTIEQTALVLNVSRQYVVHLLDDGQLAHRTIGTKRLIREQDLMAFKDGRDGRRRVLLTELMQLSQEYGGYDEIPTSTSAQDAQSTAHALDSE